MTMTVYGLELFIGPVEAFWLLTLAISCVISAAALADAIADRRAILALNGRAKEFRSRRLIGVGNIRRESVRLAIQLILFSLAVPSVFDDRDIPITPALVLFLCLPAILLINSILDMDERRKLSQIIQQEIEREVAGQRRRGGDGGPGQ